MDSGCVKGERASYWASAAAAQARFRRRLMAAWGVPFCTITYCPSQCWGRTTAPVPRRLPSQLMVRCMGAMPSAANLSRRSWRVIFYVTAR
jgi:hypothetical protein